MGDETGYKIVKVNHTSPSVPKKVAKTRSKHKKPAHGILKGGKTQRKKSRFEAVRDPAKSPPTRNSGRLRILTEKGVATRRAKIAEDAKNKPIHKIRETLRKHNLNVRENAPDHLTRKIYEDAQEAGMISVS